MLGPFDSSNLLVLAWIPHIWELVILLIVVLLLFGKRLPATMRSLGLSITEFKKGVKGVEEEEDPASTSVK